LSFSVKKTPHAVHDGGCLLLRALYTQDEVVGLTEQHARNWPAFASGVAFFGLEANPIKSGAAALDILPVGNRQGEPRLLMMHPLRG
jgi:hypothetical protein